MKKENWFDKAMKEIRIYFSSHGFEVPDVEISLGFTSKGLNSSTIGQCWGRKASTSDVNHIFISPARTDSIKILSTLMHECIHAIDNCENGHGPAFKYIALKIGFKMPMRSTPPSDELLAVIKKIITKIGEYPAPTLTVFHSPRISRPPARARCKECGYTISMLKKFIPSGPPLCPLHKTEMEKKGDWDILLE